MHASVSITGKFFQSRQVASSSSAITLKKFYEWKHLCLVCASFIILEDWKPKFLLKNIYDIIEMMDNKIVEKYDKYKE